MKKLFISHASEDQNDFVRPLAEALRKEHQVWYSEYQLILGDRLLEKIDQGLASCDFGVVILSKHFFAKKWPRAELDGLFALETTSRKIILPVWKDVTEEDVKAYSPILAGRLAVSAAMGLPKVLEEIRLAVDVSERQRTLSSVDAARHRVLALRQTVADKQRSEHLSRSEDGAKLVMESIDTIWQTIQNVLTAGEDASSPIKFGFARPVPSTMYVNTIRGMYLNLHPTNLGSNSASKTVLEVKVFEQHHDQLGQLDSNPISLDYVEFKPSFRTGDEVVWVSQDSFEIYRTEEVATQIIALFVKNIEEAILTDEE